VEVGFGATGDMVPVGLTEGATGLALLGQLSGDTVTVFDVTVGMQVVYVMTVTLGGQAAGGATGAAEEVGYGAAEEVGYGGVAYLEELAGLTGLAELTGQIVVPMGTTEE